MAKMLKRFGIGVKKNSNNSPKSESSIPKPSSVHDIFNKFPDRRKQKHSLSSSSCNIHTRNSFDYTENYHSLQVNVISRASSEKHTSSASGGTDFSSEDQHSGGNPTPPRLLDDYSDPVDLKRQGTKQESKEIEDQSDDDYSTPYEVKKLRAEKEKKRLEELAKPNKEDEEKKANSTVKLPLTPLSDTDVDQDKSPEKVKSIEKECKEKALSVVTESSSEKKSEDRATTSIVESKAAKELEAEATGKENKESEEDKEQEQNKDNSVLQNDSMPRPQRVVEEPGVGPAVVQGQEHDTRPQQEYEQPWELRQINNMLFAAAEGSSGEQGEPYYINTQNELYENAQVTGAVAKPTANADDSGQTNFAGARPKEKTNQSTPQRVKQPRGPTSDGRIGNYEEPWDLSSTTNILEEAFMAKKIQPPPRDKKSPEDAQNSGVEKNGQAENCAAPKEANQPADSRPQEGYEKPWDWKPHRKDDRAQEGYEKPWDWKPHQKDERPMEEYDSPWDHRARNLEQNIVNAKNAKEGGMMSNDNNGSSPPEAPGSSGMRDARPLDEYDQPWDQRMAASMAASMAAKTAVTRTASDSSPVSQPSPVLNPQKSPASRHQSYPMQAVMSERIVPSIPLEEQGWYHGAIKRQEAERLLRIHKEGSFLVRMSESNKRDFSLSLKSARGFMHMKIVFQDGRFILGQFSSPFESIPKMIYHYSRNKLPIKGAEHMSLLHPVINQLL